MYVQLDSLSASKISSIAGGGWEVAIFPTVTSTQDVAREMASSHPSSRRLAVIADYQEYGRGQASRTWNAPAGRCLLMSALVRPELPDGHIGALPAMASLAAADGVLDSAGASVGLAWPNDLMIGNRKVGGVLTDATWAGDRLEYAAIGIGINANIRADEVSHLAPNATSLLRELGRPVDRNDLAGHILMQLAENIRNLGDQARGAREILERWRLSLGLDGRTIRVSAGQYLGAIGQVEGIDVNGLLLVNAGGTQLELRAGLSSIEVVD